MKKEVISQFQDKVSELLLRHRSILDSLTKFQESGGRVNRAIAKSVTGCGCISISASRQVCPPEIDLQNCKDYMQTHVHGQLCEHCREILSEELGNHLFYLTALCHLLEMDLADIFAEEYQRVSALGFFHLS
ncbi:MAG TPA: DUF1573 domain-containing protein [Firmicutes bacterium]|nr:DUF1573 domain-containing protein [Bacillota bacterium]